MKKIYSLSLLLVASLGFAQGSENFNTAVTLTSAYADGAFVGNGGIPWTYGHSRDAGVGTPDDYSIDGPGIMLRRAQDSYLEATVATGGITSISFQYKKAFTGNNVRQLEVIINGTSVGTTDTFGDTPTGADPTIHSVTINNINVASPFTMRIKNVTPALGADFNRQAVIDNISWTGYTAGVKDNSIAGLSIFPNPLSGNVLNITSASTAVKTVAVYDVLGKNVINAKVTNGTVNVAGLNSGVYIVKVTEEGKTATRKLVIK